MTNKRLPRLSYRTVLGSAQDLIAQAWGLTCIALALYFMWSIVPLMGGDVDQPGAAFLRFAGYFCVHSMTNLSLGWTGTDLLPMKFDDWTLYNWAMFYYCSVVAAFGTAIILLGLAYVPHEIQNRQSKTK